MLEDLERMLALRADLELALRDMDDDLVRVSDFSEHQALRFIVTQVLEQLYPFPTSTFIEPTPVARAAALEVARGYYSRRLEQGAFPLMVLVPWDRVVHVLTDLEGGLEQVLDAVQVVR